MLFVFLGEVSDIFVLLMMEKRVLFLKMGRKISKICSVDELILSDELEEISQSGVSSGEKTSIYFKKEMIESRNFSILGFINSSSNSFLDVCASCGVLGARLKSFNPSLKISLNDYSYDAYKWMSEHIEDVNVSYLDSKKSSLPKAEFVEIDPYGCPKKFIINILRNFTPNFMSINQVHFRVNKSKIHRKKVFEQKFRELLADLEGIFSDFNLSFDVLGFYCKKYWLKFLIKINPGVRESRSKIFTNSDFSNFFPKTTLTKDIYGPFWIGDIVDKSFWKLFPKEILSDFEDKFTSFLNEPNTPFYLESFEAFPGNQRKIDEIVDDPANNYCKTVFSAIGLKKKER